MKFLKTEEIIFLEVKSMDETLKKQLEITACKVRLGILEEYSTQSRVIRADRSL